MAWSSAAAIWGRIVLAVGTWFSKWWRWIAVTLAVVLAYFFGLRKAPIARTVAFPEKEKADAEADKRKAELEEEMRKQEAHVAANAEEIRQDSIEDIRVDTQDAKVHDSVTQYLHQVGQEVRK